MKTTIMKTDRRFFKYLNLLLFFTGLTFVTTWLPFLRGILDGNSYIWGTTLFGVRFSGTGLEGDFYYVIGNTVIGFLLLYSFYWTRKRMLFYALLCLWYGSMIANAFYEVFLGEGYVFHGDTLDIHLDLSYIVIPLMIALAVLVILVIRKDLRMKFKPIWTRKNRLWLLILTLPLAAQYFLLGSGEPHGSTDQIGVIISLLQVVFLCMPFKAFSFDTVQKVT